MFYSYSNDMKNILKSLLSNFEDVTVVTGTINLFSMLTVTSLILDYIIS